MAKKTLNEMTIAEIETELFKLQQQRDEAKAQMRELVAVRDAQVAAETVVKKFDELLPAEQEAMRRHILAQGIGGGESVGGTDIG